jgi:glutamate/tyrosine decarboxylase-like PLP-dependent enzyme
VARFDWHPEPELIDVRDPEDARPALEKLGAEATAEALDWLYDEAMRRPTRPDRYPDVRRAFFGEAGRPGPAPIEGAPSAEVFREFRERLAPFTFNAQNPGSYSFFTPPPLPMAIAGETLAGWINQGIDLWLSGTAGPFVEEEVVTWLRDAAGYGGNGWGVLTSGGIMANLMGLAVARDVHLAVLRGTEEPPRGGALDGVRLYASLADVAEREGLWTHVDAAYGGAALLSPREAGRLRGLERADSITIDPHKWFFQPYDIGGLLVKERGHLLETFHHAPEYYRDVIPEDEPLHWYRYSIEGTRRFRALKLWLSWKHLGTEGFARLIEHTVDLARHLADRCAAEGFEVITPELSVVCFRHVPVGHSDDAVDAYQNRLQRALEESGEGWVSTTTLRGHTFLRAGIVNYLSTEADADRLVDALLRVPS